MVRIQKQKEVYVPPEHRIYNDSELRDFETYIQQFYDPYELQNGAERGKTINWFNYRKLSMAWGATNKDGAVIMVYDRAEKQDELENIYSQWQKWKRKKEYAEEKRLEQLSERELAMQIDTAFDQELERE